MVLEETTLPLLIAEALLESRLDSAFSVLERPLTVPLRTATMMMAIIRATEKMTVDRRRPRERRFFASDGVFSRCGPPLESCEYASFGGGCLLRSSSGPDVLYDWRPSSYRLGRDTGAS